MKYLILDTETANTLDDPLVYDVGFAVIDENGVVYEKASFVNADVFLDKDLMATAYFKEKVPQYWNEIKDGSRQLKRLFNIRKAIKDTMKNYEIDTVIAHNIKFDKRSLNTTIRYQTSSRFRWFFPYGTKFFDTLAAAREYYKDNAEYLAFCETHNYLTKYKKPQFTAEILYRFISGENEFEERHTGLEDCMIEKEIFRVVKGK